MWILVKPHERVFVWEEGKAARMLGAGKHWLWPTWKTRRLERHDTTQVLATVTIEELGLVPNADIEVVTLGTFERAVVSRAGVPVKWLEPGVHLVWTTAKVSAKGEGVRREVPAITVDRIVVSGLDAPLLTEAVKMLVPPRDRAEVLVPTGFVAVRVVDGRAESVQGPGRHAAWTVAQQVRFELVDVREQVLHLTGQEVLTKDRVSLRLNAAAEWRVVDALKVAGTSKSAADALHLAVQLSLRALVGQRTLDELLAQRETIGELLLPALRERASALGLSIGSFGVRDVVLPGEMKTLLNRVIEAQKEAEANVILRREETAAARSMAQTAKVMAENPLVLKLKELEAWKELAARVGHVNVVLGEGALDKLRLTTDTAPRS